MPEKPELRLVVDNSAAQDDMLDMLLRLKAVAKDPDGEHLWLLLEPRPGTAAED